MFKDKEGRIKCLSPIYDKEVHSGHSVCNICGKDMPTSWHIVCRTCNRTFCYEHAVDIDNYWYCPECAKKEKEDVYK